MRPQMRLTNVVLPAPFGPMGANLAFSEIEVDMLDRVEAAELA